MPLDKWQCVVKWQCIGGAHEADPMFDRAPDSAAGADAGTSPAGCESSAPTAAADPGFAVCAAEARPPRPKSSRTRRVARHAALHCGGLLASSIRSPGLRCLYLHSVYDDQTAAFRSLLERLRRIGPFVGTQEVVDVVTSGKTVEGCRFHLSFDDGFDNNYRNAVSVLDDLGIRAAFFVPSRFVDAPDAEVAERWWKPRDAARPTRPLRWDWLAEMLKLGHDVGSHTRTHARLSGISHERAMLEDEVMASKREIEDRLGVACRYFAWPYGTFRDLDEASLAAIERAGYEACFSAVRGRIEPGRTSALAIPRHHFEADWPWLHLRFFSAGGGEWPARTPDWVTSGRRVPHYQVSASPR